MLNKDLLILVINMGKKKKKKRKLKLKSVFIFTLILAIIVGIICLLSMLNVKSYFIYGNKYLSDEEVLKELKLDKKSSYLFTNTFSEKAITRKSKLIKDVKIKKTLALEVKVYINEYKILFIKDNKTVLENSNEINYIYENAPILLNKREDYLEEMNNFINQYNDYINNLPFEEKKRIL